MTKIELKQMYFQMFTLPNFTFYLIVGKYIIHYGIAVKIYNIKQKSHMISIFVQQNLPFNNPLLG